MSELLFGDDGDVTEEPEGPACPISVRPENAPKFLGECNIGDVVTVRLVVMGGAKSPVYRLVRALKVDGESEAFSLDPGLPVSFESRRNP